MISKLLVGLTVIGLYMIFKKTKPKDDDSDDIGIEYTYSIKNNYFDDPTTNTGTTTFGGTYKSSVFSPGIGITYGF